MMYLVNKFKQYKFQLSSFVKDFLTIYNLKKMNHKPMIYLFGCSYHSNMGDHAITQCMIDWLEKNYPEHYIYLFTYITSRKKVFRYIRKIIKPVDKLFFSGGYHLTDIYKEQNVYCQIVDMFPDFPIMIFPQTINYRDQKVAGKTASTFNKHGNITILCRDEVSYDVASKLFHNCKLLLYPDIVTLMIGEKRYTQKRDGILFCLRKDKEQEFSNFNKQDIDYLKTETAFKARTGYTDTTISMSYKEIIINNRKNILMKTIEKYASYKVVITNKYHGIIFSLIAGTPVIVLASSDYKFSSGVKWFIDIFKDYFYYCNNNEEVLKSVDEVLQKSYTYSLPDYFNTNYWQVLKPKLESEI